MSTPSASHPPRASYPRPRAPPSLKRIAAPPPHPTLRAPPGPSPSPHPSRPSLGAYPPAGWTRSTHAVPAAFPRRFAESFGALHRGSKPQVLNPPREGEAETREERLARNEGEGREMLRKRYDAVESGGGEEAGLWMAAERWVREARGLGGVDGGEGEGVTLVFTHANGFHKESWYATLKRLFELEPPSEAFGGGQLAAAAPLRVDEVWLLDDVHHAASIDLNAGRIGPVHGWSDGGRDVINFIQHAWLGPYTPHPPILEWHDSDAPAAPASSASSTAPPRKIIGVGHSFGGNALVQAAHHAPNLFHALFLVEPMCPGVAPPRSSFDIPNMKQAWPLVMGAVRRRAVWPSREAAAAVRASPFFAKWDQDVWEAYLAHALVPVPVPAPTGAIKGEDDIAATAAVQLATPPWAEACVFAEATGLGEGWDALPGVQVPVGFLMGNDPRTTFGEAMTAQMVWRAPRSSNEIVPDAGHLIVQENPTAVADALNRFLAGLGASEGEPTRAQAKL